MVEKQKSNEVVLLRVSIKSSNPDCDTGMLLDDIERGKPELKKALSLYPIGPLTLKRRGNYPIGPFESLRLHRDLPPCLSTLFGDHKSIERAVVVVEIAFR